MVTVVATGGAVLILVVRLAANKNASFFQIRVTRFARYTVIRC